MAISVVVAIGSLYFIWRGISYIQRRNNKKTTEMSEKTRFRRAVAFIFGLIVVQCLIIRDYSIW